MVLLTTEGYPDDGKPIPIGSASLESIGAMDFQLFEAVNSLP